MRKYTLIATLIALFFGPQIVSMDRSSSTKNLIEFEKSLGNFLKSKRETFLSKDTSMPVSFARNLFPFKQNILYIVEKYHIDRSTAEQIFMHTLSDIVLQEIALRNHTDNVKNIPNWNRGFSAVFHSNLDGIAESIFAE